MDKKGFIEKLASALETTKSEAEKKAQAIFETISELLTQDEEVMWPGFGRFSVAHRSSRLGRNPKTGKAIKIAAKTTPHFKPASQLKQKVMTKVKVKPKTKA